MTWRSYIILHTFKTGTEQTRCSGFQESHRDYILIKIYYIITKRTPQFHVIRIFLPVFCLNQVARLITAGSNTTLPSLQYFCLLLEGDREYTDVMQMQLATCCSFINSIKKVKFPSFSQTVPTIGHMWYVYNYEMNLIHFWFRVHFLYTSLKSEVEYSTKNL